MRKIYLLFLLVVPMIISCSDNDSDPVNIPFDNPEAVAAWGTVMAGNDPEEITWPDLSENYWEYTMDVTQNPNVGIRIKGQYPTDNVRFFNITMYNDVTTERLGSLEDFNITPNKESENPFDKNVSGANFFEVNFVPTGTAANVKNGLNNVLEFPANTGRLMLLLRIYFNSIDHPYDFGGIKCPALVFFNTQTGEEIKSAVRAESQYYQRFSMMVKAIPVLKKQQAMAFTLAPNVMYSNGPTGYASAFNRINTGDALCFSFIPPAHPATAADNRTADVRYWSICIGDTMTYTPTTLVDKTVIKDGEYVNFMIVTKNDPNLSAIKARIADGSLKINLIEWDIVKRGEPLAVFYRQMFIREGFDYSVQKIMPYPPKNAIGIPDQSLQPNPFDENLAHRVLGKHGPYGIVVPSATFLQLPGSRVTATIRTGDDRSVNQ